MQNFNNSLRAYLRLFLFVVVTIWYLSIILILDFLGKGGLEVGKKYHSNWARVLMKVLGIHVNLKGEFPEGNALLVANHRSYIDGLLFLALKRCTLVIKADISTWPLIGKGAELTQTILVNRSSKNSRQETKEKIRQSLLEGNTIAIFPEGTTSIGPKNLPFKKGAFEVAAKENIPIIPVAFEYQEPKDAWINDQEFLPHFLACFGKKRTIVSMSIGNLIEGTTESAISIAENWIGKTCLLLRQNHKINYL